MNGLIRLQSLLEGARRSRWRLWLLNLLLGRLVPFNRPHGMRILELGTEHVKTIAPFRRSNQNHIRGIHACCIATVAEFSSGLLLLSRLDPSRYRLIMSHLDIDYRYQGKSAIIAETRLEEQQLKDEILNPLADNDQLLFTQITEVHDTHQHHIATARVTWQIKRWDTVRTKG